MKPSLLPQLLCSVLVALAASAAEEPTKPLTNADVIKMLEAKLPESVIITQIQSSQTRFDTSTDAIIELHKHGVSEAVLNAMLKPPGATAPDAAAGKAVAAAAGEDLNPANVYLIDGERRILLTKGGYQKMSVRPMAWGTKQKVKFDGPRAELRISNPSPVFEVTIGLDVRVSENVLLVSPKVEKKERELEIAHFDIAGQHKGRFNKVQTTAEQKATHGGRYATWHVKPAAPLAPGEYVLAVSDGSINKDWTGNYYDFGVDAPK
jgi:hypothetical protein